MPGLQLLVSNVVGALRKAGLEVNASKCATMIIRVNRRCWYTVWPGGAARILWRPCAWYVGGTASETVRVGHTWAFTSGVSYHCRSGHSTA